MHELMGYIKPVYFIGQRGPNLPEDTLHPAYGELQEFSKEITTKVRPKAVVVISSHWKCQGEKIFVNNIDYPGIIYEGVPPQRPVPNRV